MTEYTLKEAADKLGMTKNCIKGRLKNVPDTMIRKGEDGIIYLSDTAFPILVQTRSRTRRNQGVTSSTDGTTENQGNGTDYQTAQQPGSTSGSQTSSKEWELMEQTIALLRDQLAEKDRQIAAKDKQLASLADSLKAAQTLQAAHMSGGILEDPDKEKAPDTQPLTVWQRIKGIFG